MNNLKKMNKTNKGQAFSTDIIVVIVVILFGALFLVMNQVNSQKLGNNDLNQKYAAATIESKIIVDDLKKEDIISNDNSINANKLLALDHNTLKEKLGVKGDFAIAFEKDGKLVKLDPQNNINCVGSSNIIVNGQNCGN